MPIIPNKNHAKESFIPNMTSVGLKTKELVTQHCGCHGNLVTIATRHVADAFYPKQAQCQIQPQYDSRQRSY